MRCVTCRGVGDYPHSRSTPVPSPGPGEVLLRVERAGICAGDAKCYAGAPLFWGDASRPPYVQPPVIPGHEFAGHIAALGPGASRDGGSDNDGGGNGRWAVGDRVTAEQVVACGECLYCRKGLRWLCAPHDIFGFHTCVPGAMAEYMVLPAKALLHRVPNSLTPKEAVFIEPLRYVQTAKVVATVTAGFLTGICPLPCTIGWVLCRLIARPVGRDVWLSVLRFTALGRPGLASVAGCFFDERLADSRLPSHTSSGLSMACCSICSALWWLVAGRCLPSLSPLSPPPAVACTRWSAAIRSPGTRWW